MRIGLVTCRVLPEPDPDAAPLAAALRARGHAPIDVAWDEPGSPPGGVDLFVLRSPWNYHERPDDFLKWVDRAAALAPVLNPPEVIRWNIHKRYLLDLAAAGVPIVPTELVQRGRVLDGAAKRAIDRFGEVVVKPAIGAGSAGARRFRADQRRDAIAWLERLTSTGDALIQPHLDGFREPGERALIWINGAWTHAIRKRPRFAGEHETVEAAEPPMRAELAVAERALAAAPPGCAYARADLVAGADGDLLLSELELMEPSLYFDHGPAALPRFIEMLEARQADA